MSSPRQGVASPVRDDLQCGMTPEDLTKYLRSTDVATITVLNLSGVGVTDFQNAMFSSLTCLESLSVCNNDLGTIDFVEAVALTMMYLDISGNRVISIDPLLRRGRVVLGTFKAIGNSLMKDHTLEVLSAMCVVELELSSNAEPIPVEDVVASGCTAVLVDGQYVPHYMRERTGTSHARRLLVNGAKRLPPTAGRAIELASIMTSEELTDRATLTFLHSYLTTQACQHQECPTLQPIALPLDNAEHTSFSRTHSAQARNIASVSVAQGRGCQLLGHPPFYVDTWRQVAADNPDYASVLLGDLVFALPDVVPPLVRSVAQHTAAKAGLAPETRDMNEKVLLECLRALNYGARTVLVHLLAPTLLAPLLTRRNMMCPRAYNDVRAKIARSASNALSSLGIPQPTRSAPEEYLHLLLDETATTTTTNRSQRLGADSLSISRSIMMSRMPTTVSGPSAVHHGTSTTHMHSEDSDDIFTPSVSPIPRVRPLSEIKHMFDGDDDPSQSTKNQQRPRGAVRGKPFEAELVGQSALSAPSQHSTSYHPQTHTPQFFTASEGSSEKAAPNNDPPEVRAEEADASGNKKKKGEVKQRHRLAVAIAGRPLVSSPIKTKLTKHMFEQGDEVVIPLAHFDTAAKVVIAEVLDGSVVLRFVLAAKDVIVDARQSRTTPVSPRLGVNKRVMRGWETFHDAARSAKEHKAKVLMNKYDKRHSNSNVGSELPELMLDRRFEVLGSTLKWVDGRWTCQDANVQRTVGAVLSAFRREVRSAHEARRRPASAASVGLLTYMKQQRGGEPSTVINVTVPSPRRRSPSPAGSPRSRLSSGGRTPQPAGPRPYPCTVDELTSLRDTVETSYPLEDLLAWVYEDAELQLDALSQPGAVTGFILNVAWAVGAENETRFRSDLDYAKFCLRRAAVVHTLSHNDGPISPRAEGSESPRRDHDLAKALKNVGALKSVSQFVPMHHTNVGNNSDLKQKGGAQHHVGDSAGPGHHVFAANALNRMKVEREKAKFVHDLRRRVIGQDQAHYKVISCSSTLRGMRANLEISGQARPGTAGHVHGFMPGEVRTAVTTGRVRRPHSAVTVTTMMAPKQSPERPKNSPPRPRPVARPLSSSQCVFVPNTTVRVPAPVLPTYRSVVTSELTPQEMNTVYQRRVAASASKHRMYTTSFS
eukprot:PhM_4_TR2013/c0_g1_i1/m.19124